MSRAVGLAARWAHGQRQRLRGRPIYAMMVLCWPFGEFFKAYCAWKGGERCSSFGFGGEARPKIEAFPEISMTKVDGIAQKQRILGRRLKSMKLGVDFG